MSNKEIIAYKPFINYNIKSLENENIIHWMIMSLGSGVSGSTKIHIDILFTSDFDENNPYRNIKLTENKVISRKNFIDIFEILCIKCPNLINIKHFSDVHKSKQLTDILTTYYTTNDDDNYDNCFICQSPNNYQLLNSPCCKSKIHLNCLVKLYKTNGNTCKTCNNELHGVTVTDYNKVIFPDLDIYIDFMTSSYIFADTYSISSS